MDKNGKNAVVNEMIKVTNTLLQENPVMLVTDLEDALLKEFGDRLDTATYLAGGKRKRWENLTDWVKARLTKDGLIEYYDLPGGRYIVYLQWVGYLVGDTGEGIYVVSKNDVSKILYQISNLKE